MSWRHVVEKYPCGKCGAAIGERCRTINGNGLSVPHADRWNQDSQRCPKCGDRVSDGAEIGALCDRCRLIRRLEIERVTHYQRRD